MKIFSWNEILNDLQNGCQCSLFSRGSGISVGSFDGLHKGHRILIKTLVEESKKKNIPSGVITFKRPLPSIKHSSDYQGDVSTLNQRLKLFEQLGLDFVILVDFNSEFAARSGSDFFQLVMKLCNMKILVEGIDFRCGYKGAMDCQAIQYFCTENKIDVHFVDPVYYSENDSLQERISSSYIRKMISMGFFATVEELLERKYQIDLEELNASLEFTKGDILQVLPAAGIYHCKNQLDEDVKVEITEDILKLDVKSTYISF